MLILPLNHLDTGRIVFTGDYTYIKVGKKSQIDYVFTNNHKKVKQFYIDNKTLEISDHKSIHCKIKGQLCLTTKAILMWAKDSNNMRYDKKENISRVNFYVDEEKLEGEVENLGK